MKTIFPLLLVGGIVLFGILRLSPTAGATPTDMIVGIAPGRNAEAQELTVMPANWAQPAYTVTVSHKCASTLEVGYGWPAASVICKSSGSFPAPTVPNEYPTETAGPWIPRVD